MRNISLSLPKTWKELSANHLLFISREMVKEQTRTEFLLKTFVCISGLVLLEGRSGDSTFLFEKKGELPFPLTANQLAEFIHECDFLLEKITEVSPIKKIARRKAYEFMMYEACFDEFISALNFFTAFQHTKNEKWLDKLCVVLYPTGKWSDNNPSKYAKKFSNLEFHLKYTAFLWFCGLMNVIAKECPDMYTEGSSDVPVDIKENIHGMLNLLSNEDVTKYDDLLKVKMWDALYVMNTKAKNINRTNKQNNKDNV
jgi:hypothetical protein